MEVHIWKAHPVGEAKERFILVSGPEGVNSAEAYEAGLRAGISWKGEPTLTGLVESGRLAYVGCEPVYETQAQRWYNQVQRG